MIRTKPSPMETGDSLPITGGELEITLAKIPPRPLNGIVGTGFVLVDYFPPEKPPAYRLISSQYVTGDQKS